MNDLAESVQMAGTVRTHNTSSGRRVVPLVSSISSRWSFSARIDSEKTVKADSVFPPASRSIRVSKESYKPLRIYCSIIRRERERERERDRDSKYYMKYCRSHAFHNTCILPLYCLDITCTCISLSHEN